MEKPRAAWFWWGCLLIAVLFGIAIFLMPDATVPWEQFEPRLRNAIYRQGYTIEEERTVGRERAPLPLVVYLRPLYWQPYLRPKPKVTAEFGFPDIGVHMLIRQGETSKLEVLAPYLHSQACAIYLRTSSGSRAAGEKLRAALEIEFPGLPIDLDSNHAALFDDPPGVGK